VVGPFATWAASCAEWGGREKYDLGHIVERGEFVVEPRGFGKGSQANGGATGLRNPQSTGGLGKTLELAKAPKKRPPAGTKEVEHERGGKRRPAVGVEVPPPSATLQICRNFKKPGGKATLNGAPIGFERKGARGKGGRGSVEA